MKIGCGLVIENIVLEYCFLNVNYDIVIM